MGSTLQEIVKKYYPIDFVFKSHSSANSRMSYEIVDDLAKNIDDIEWYIKSFTDTVKATGTKYAVPFASNHCHLHKDSWKYNDIVQTPAMVKNYFVQNKIDDVELKIMISGDSWDSDSGFDISNNDWFSNRKPRLKEYLDLNREKLNQFYLQEDNAKIKISRVEKYYRNLASKLPFLLRKKLTNIKYTYVLYTKEIPTYVFNIEISTGSVEELDKNTVLDFDVYPIQIHTTAFIYLRCIAFRTFSHMGISKRVIYKLKKDNLLKMKMLNFIYNLEEYDMLPVSRNFSKRNIETWMLRYREVFLYCQLLKDKILYKKNDFSKYLPPYLKNNDTQQ